MKWAYSPPPVPCLPSMPMDRCGDPARGGEAWLVQRRRDRLNPLEGRDFQSPARAHPPLIWGRSDRDPGAIREAFGTSAPAGRVPPELRVLAMARGLQRSGSDAPSGSARTCDTHPGIALWRRRHAEATRISAAVLNGWSFRLDDGCAHAAGRWWPCPCNRYRWTVPRPWRLSHERQPWHRVR